MVDTRTVRKRLLEMAKAYPLTFSNLAIRDSALDIYKYVKHSSVKVTSRDISDHFEVSRKKASTTLLKLVRLGYLERQEIDYEFSDYKGIEYGYWVEA